MLGCFCEGMRRCRWLDIPDIQLHESFDESSPVIETTTGVVHRSVWSLEDGQWRIAYEDWR